jgi:5'-nucleotidase
MIPDSRKERIPVKLQILLGFCILLTLILAPILLSSFFPGTVPAMHTNANVHLKILAINDFHGQLPPGQTLNKRPVGSAPVLASYLKTALASGNADATIIALPGDVVGASPPQSGLLSDEPTLLFFNEFANACCAGTCGRGDSGCNMITTPGNHEFDRGTGELLREVYGGNGNVSITHLADPYPGSRSSYTCTNVVWKANGTPIFPPYIIRNISGIPVAFIGADTITTPERLAPHRADDILFLNETESINRYVAEVRKDGIHAIVVLLHEGGTQDAYEGPTRNGMNVTGRITGIVAGLDGDVDVVLSGHTHAFTNAYFPNAAGNPVLLTQAWSYSKGYADVDLTLDRVTRDIVNKSARIIADYADSPPGTVPDPEAAAFLRKDGLAVAPVISRQVAVIARDITRDENAAGESALGDLLADSQRSVMETDVAFITTGTMRSDMKAGNATWGDMFTIQPFSGTIVVMKMSGQQIHDVLEQQWTEPLPPHPLSVSGLSYSYDATRPAGSRVKEIHVGGVSLDPAAIYTAAMMDYLSIGGDGYTVFTNGTMITTGPSDVDTLASYVGSLPQPVNLTIDGRIQRIT